MQYKCFNLFFHFPFSPNQNGQDEKTAKFVFIYLFLRGTAKLALKMYDTSFTVYTVFNTSASF